MHPAGVYLISILTDHDWRGLLTAPIPDVFYDFEWFTLDQLERIVPIGQTQPLDDVRFTALSLECYQTGFVLTALTEQTYVLPNLDTRETPLALRGFLMITDATDDHGTRYVSRLRSGSGGGRPNGHIATRIVYGLAPALNQAARTLILELAQIENVHYTPEGHPAWSPDDVIAGPWTTTFSIGQEAQ